MPRKPRKELCDPCQVAVHHLWTRTVRRCFLFGRDPLTGKDFSHREGWITQRLKHLANFFAIDVFAFAAMSNHCHLVIRTRPDRVDHWSDQEVARRWLSMLSRRNRSPEPTEKEIQAVLGKPDAVAKLRRRLSDPSWLMRMLCQHVAIRCNQEDECSGRVFQDRFQQSALQSEAEVLACMAYVDLNPLRAGMSETLEGYADVSIGQRLRTLSGETPDPAAWLQPLEREQPAASQQLTAEQRAARRRELNGALGCIEMTLEDYGELLCRLAERSRPELRGRLAPHRPRVFSVGGSTLDLDRLHDQLTELSARYVVRRPKHEREYLERRAARNPSADEACCTAAG
jgi:REP element-mobilizing transposase RayT